MKESSRFYSSLGLLVILNAVIKPVWIFGIDRQVQNTVGVAEYGNYFALFNLSIVFSFLLDWGLTSFFNTQLASQKEQFIHKAGHFLFIKLLFAFIYAAVVGIAAFVSGVERWDIVAGVILIQVFTSLFIFFRSIITAEQWFTTDAWLSVLDKTLMIGLCGAFLFFPLVLGAMNIQSFLWSQVTCTALAGFTAWSILFKKGVRFSLNVTGVLFDKKIFYAALPYAIIILLMSMHYRLDGFLLERVHPNGNHETGIYAGAYRLLDASNMITFLFSSFLLPYIARQWSKKEDIKKVVLTLRHLLIVYAIVITGITVYLAPEIQQLLYHHTDASSVGVLQWCIPALIGYTLVSIYGTVLTATGHIRAFGAITLVAVLINIILNFLLIPSLGAKGCCIAALISQLICGIATMIYTKQKLMISFHASSLLIYIFIGVVWVAVFYAGGSWSLDKFATVIAGVLITLLIMIATRLIKASQWISFFKAQLSTSK
ncbi:MAG TPA: polysaccharide biosynthesis C-terminal domain-containing protein [Chitinophagaceae bacterium]